MKELVSVIVPVYYAAPYVAKTIEMVRRQTHTAWELLLIDDCSEDGSAEVIEKALAACRHHGLRPMSEDVRRVEEYALGGGQSAFLVRKRSNEGAAKARNTGLKMAQGRYIAFLDADDVWSPDKLEKELGFMKEMRAGFVFTAYEFGDEKAVPTGKIVHVPERLTYREALSRTVIFTTTVLLDRKAIPQELIAMPDVASEDTATWWQILRAGHIAYGLDEVLAIYRRPEKSLSSNKFTAIKRIWGLYRKQEKLSVISSMYYFVFWAYRATIRRL